MEYKETIFENTYSSSRCEKQENSFDECNTDEHVHNSKALPELVDDLTK
jgi:hypothetical protein